ncbi:MAG: thiaminase II [Pseudomonadota bacterium]
MAEDFAAELGEAGPLFAALRSAGAKDWQDYTRHAFVAGLADGSLPLEAFKHYLVQDYIFLIHFARAYALGVYKAETVEEMRHCQASVHVILEEELNLHLSYCKEWGLDEDHILASAEDPANLSYTRYVLDRGMSGDYLELLIALSPCAIGYGEIACRLKADPQTKVHGNPYTPWIEAYSGDAYRELALSAARHLDAAAERRLGLGAAQSPRFQHLAAVFSQATRLEVGFWQMGLDAVSTSRAEVAL